MSQFKRFLISFTALVSLCLTLSVISSRASSIQGDVVFGGSNLSTVGSVPYVNPERILTQDSGNLLYDTAASPRRLISPSHAVIVGGAAKILMQSGGLALSSDSSFSWKDQTNLDAPGTYDVGMGRQDASTLNLLRLSAGTFADLILRQVEVARVDNNALAWVQASLAGDYQLFSIAAGAFRFNMTSAGLVQVSGYGAGTLTTDASGNVTAISDERLKYIQRPFTRGLRQISELRPIIYKWRPESGLETQHEYAGFSAQQVKRFIPEAVGQDPAGHLTFQDRPIEAALVNAVQELAAQVKTLQGRVAQLEAKQRAKP